MKLKFKYRLAVELLNIIACTWRFSINGIIPEKPAIVCFWHGEMLPVWKLFAKKLPAAIVSSSRDGEVLSAILKKWKYKLVRGSSSKGGKEALEQMIDLSRKELFLITPDGPKGPAKIFKPGAVVAAKKGGAPIYYCRIIAPKSRMFTKSWDSFILPLPFAGINVIIKGPVYVDSSLNREETGRIINWLEDEMNNDIILNGTFK